MLVQLVPLHEDGTRNEQLGTVTVPKARLRSAAALRDLLFPAATDAEAEAERLALFRNAQRLFESDPALLERMRQRMPGAKASRRERRAAPPSPLAAVEALRQAILAPCDERVRYLLAAPADQTLSLLTWGDYWVIWHLAPRDPEAGVYASGQPFGDPLIELWRGKDEAPWHLREVPDGQR